MLRNIFLLASCLSLGLFAQDGHVQTTRTGAKPLPLPRSEDVWHFVVFGDRTSGPPEGVKVLAQAVADTNLLDPDLVMTVGDLVQGYNDRPAWMKQMQEYRDTMGALKRPWYPVPGNHDIYWRGTNPPAEEHETDYETHFGPLWYWFRHKSAAFVVLYSDEQNPAGGRRGFGPGAYNRFSDTQLKWLEETLHATREAEHVFVFLHHPRWISKSYPDANWSAVHERLKAAGNVKMVFAGHIHQMRYDGVKDGIEYVTLGATGGEFSPEIPKAGLLHHFDVVTVRKTGISLAAIPVGVVVDPRQMTPERLEDVDRLLEATHPEVLEPLSFRLDGSAEGTYRLRVHNPSRKPIAITLLGEPQDSGVQFLPDHEHATLLPQESKALEFRYSRLAGGNLDHLARASFRLERDYLGEGLRITMPPVLVPVELALADAEPDSAGLPNGRLLLDGKSGCLRIPADAADFPDGPFTVESWVYASSWKGRRPIVAKTESSEWGIYGDEGDLSFLVHGDGKYTSVEVKAALRPKVWHHLAGVWDGQELRLYCDGTLIGKKAFVTASRTRNTKPLLVGADPNRQGRPTDFFAGEIDEVRISTTARYAGESFSPERRHQSDESTFLLLHLDRDLGPVTPDSGPRASHPERVGAARCVVY